MPTYTADEIQNITLTMPSGGTVTLDANTLTSTVTASTTGITSSSVTIDPDWYIGTTTTTVPGNITVTPSFSTTYSTLATESDIAAAKEECKKYCDKVDEHVDKLEEDMEFFNNERLNHKDLIDSLIGTVQDQRDDIEKLKTEIENMKSYTNWLEQEINDLRGPNND